MPLGSGATPHAAPAAPAAAGSARAPVSLETRIGADWLLYIGIATLVLGASYFIKYAFENNWITPVMRVALGGAAGLTLLEAGRRFSTRGLASYGQMLAGGGIVILYVAVYAALDFYQLIAPTTAFALMVGVTALAAWRAHAEKAQGLAVLAVTGGFLTPSLVGGDARSPHVLFTYDAILVLGTLWLARRHQWPLLHLVSFVLTGLTISSWGERYFTSARWLSTELWLTLFAALFLIIWRTIPASATLSNQAARAVLGFGPFIYHLASLAILWRHTVGLLIYLIAATALGVIVAGHLRRPWLRLATWVLVALPALEWLATRPARWDSAPFIALFGIYVLHLVSQLRESTAQDEPPPLIELAMLHLNGLWLWGGLALLFEKFLLDRLGAMTFVAAAWYGALAAGTRARNREASLHLLALAGAFVAAGVAIELDGAAVTAAWAVEGAAIVVLGLATHRAWLQVGGGALLTAAVARLFNELLDPAVTTAVPVANVRTLTTLLVAGLIAYLAWRYREVSVEDAAVAGRSQLVATLVITVSVLLLVWASSEVDGLFARTAWFGQEVGGAGAVTSASLARDVALSTLWATYALLLIAIGIRRDYPPLRILAILLLAMTVAKVFLIDLSRLDRFYRILSTVGLGLLLLIASYLYQRFTTDRTSET